jgi:hypothetical protein
MSQTPDCQTSGNYNFKLLGAGRAWQACATNIVLIFARLNMLVSFKMRVVSDRSPAAARASDGVRCWPVGWASIEFCPAAPCAPPTVCSRSTGEQATPPQLLEHSAGRPSGRLEVNPALPSAG